MNAKVRWFPITFGSFSFGDMKVTFTFVVVVILPCGSWPHTTKWNKSKYFKLHASVNRIHSGVLSTSGEEQNDLNYMPL